MLLNSFFKVSAYNPYIQFYAWQYNNVVYYTTELPPDVDAIYNSNDELMPFGIRSQNADQIVVEYSSGGQTLTLTLSRAPSEDKVVTEFYSPVYDKTDGGEFTTELGWGKYKITFSGGGGAGGAAAFGSGGHAGQYANNGSAGEEKTFYYTVGKNDTITLSGIIGTGAAGSYAKGLGEISVPVDMADASVGAVGTGYSNGGYGSARSRIIGESGVQYTYDGYGAAGGSGGGSSSVLINGALYSTARGGNGGTASARTDVFPAQSGGKGGSGGVSDGTGAAGGAGKTFYKSQGTSGAGTTGYIHIYMSNIKPIGQQ